METSLETYRNLVGKLFRIKNPHLLKNFTNSVSAIENIPEFDGRFSKYQELSDNWAMEEKIKKNTYINNKNPVLVVSVTEKECDAQYFVVRFLHEQILWEIPVKYSYSYHKYYKSWHDFFVPLEND